MNWKYYACRTYLSRIKAEGHVVTFDKPTVHDYSGKYFVTNRNYLKALPSRLLLIRKLSLRFPTFRFFWIGVWIVTESFARAVFTAGGSKSVYINAISKHLKQIKWNPDIRQITHFLS